MNVYILFFEVFRSKRSINNVADKYYNHYFHFFFRTSASVDSIVTLNTGTQLYTQQFFFLMPLR